MADAILAGGTLTKYDKPRIAQLCEKAGLYLRALQVYLSLRTFNTNRKRSRNVQKSCKLVCRGVHGARL